MIKIQICKCIKSIDGVASEGYTYIIIPSKDGKEHCIYQGQTIIDSDSYTKENLQRILTEHFIILETFYIQKRRYIREYDELYSSMINAFRQLQDKFEPFKKVDLILKYKDQGKAPKLYNGSFPYFDNKKYKIKLLVKPEDNKASLNGFIHYLNLDQSIITVCLIHAVNPSLVTESVLSNIENREILKSFGI